MDDQWYLFGMGDESGTPPPLRPYQVASVRSVQRELHASQRCLCISATGTGKTEIIAALADEEIGNGGSVLVVSPLTDLVSQTAARLRGRGLDVGIEQRVLRGGTACTVASYQSLIRGGRWQQYLGKTTLTMVDETHMNYTVRSMKLLQDLCAHGSKLVGFTASPQRMKGDPLTAFYGKVAYEYPLKQAIADGWLVPPKLWLTVARDWDFSKFGQGIEDFEAYELDRILRAEQSVQFVAALVRQHYDGKPSVVFCHSIGQAERVTEILARDNIAASVVHSKQEACERDQNMDAFVTGKHPVICNVNCLTVGFDNFSIRNLFLCKPTKSHAKYLQMLGRGCRPLPGTVDGIAFAEQRRAAIAASEKSCFEVYDVTDTSRHCQLVNALDVLADSRVPENVVKRAKMRLEERSGAVDADEVLAEAEQLLEQERAEEAAKQAARDLLERDRRRELIVGVTFDAYSRDPFAEAEAPEKPKRQWRMLFGQHKGKLLSQVPEDYLRWVVSKSNCRNQAFIAGVRAELAKRKDRWVYR